MKTALTFLHPAMKRFATRILWPALVIALAMGPFASPAAFAQSNTPTLQELMPPPTSAAPRRSMNGTVQIFGRVLVHAMPVWSRFANGAAPAEQSKIQRANRPGIFRLDIIPQNEEFNDWKNLFAIVGFDKQNGSIDRPAAGAVEHFRAQCSPSNLEVFPGKKTDDRMFLVVACGNYSRARETGEVALIVILKQGDLAVSLLRQWRGKSFIAKIKSQWPVQREEIDAVLREMIQSRLLPQKQP